MLCLLRGVSLTFDAGVVYYSYEQIEETTDREPAYSTEMGLSPALEENRSSVVRRTVFGFMIGGGGAALAGGLPYLIGGPLEWMKQVQ